MLVMHVLARAARSRRMVRFQLSSRETGHHALQLGMRRMGVQKAMSDKSETTGPMAEYIGPEADAKAAAIDATLGTDNETTADVIWLLRYTTVKHNIQWPTFADMVAARGSESDAG